MFRTLSVRPACNGEYRTASAYSAMGSGHAPSCGPRARFLTMICMLRRLEFPPLSNRRRAERKSELWLNELDREPTWGARRSSTGHH
eukprot:9468340-Pyramimonas_sp.AAC.1